MPQPHGGGQILETDDDAREAVGLRRVARLPQLQHELLFRAEIDRLHVLASAQIPYVELVPVFRPEEQLRHEPAAKRDLFRRVHATQEASVMPLDHRAHARDGDHINADGVAGHVVGV